MRLVKLTKMDGQAIWVNPARVLHVLAAGAADADGALIVYDLQGGHGLVRECPREVAGRMLDPVL